MVSDRRANIIHPLIYPHPVTGDPVCNKLNLLLCFVFILGNHKKNMEAVHFDPYKKLCEFKKKISAILFSKLL